MFTNALGAYADTFTAPGDAGALTVTASVHGTVHAAQTVVLATPVGTAVAGTQAVTSEGGGCGAATATTGETSVSGCGTGAFAVAEYRGNPTDTSSLPGAVRYFDAATSVGNALTAVSITECGALSGDVLQWWNPATSAWERVSPAATFSSGPPACLQFLANGTSRPTLDDLSGTVFSLVAPPPLTAGSVAAGSPDSAPPAVTGLVPSSGVPSGGTQVTILGDGFTGATAVLFGQVTAAGFTVDSPTQITAVAPAGTGAVDVTVSTPGGSSTPGAADRFTFEPAAPTFSDIPSGFWAGTYIAELAAKGIAAGFPDGTFRPNAPATRAQFVKMLDLALELRPGSGRTSFVDVDPAAWYAPYVSAAVQAGVAQGITATCFDTDGIATREQAAVLLARALGLTQGTTVTFADRYAIDAWAVAGVDEAAAAGYLDGFPDGTLQPLGRLTRAQAAKLLAMML